MIQVMIFDTCVCESDFGKITFLYYLLSSDEGGLAGENLFVGRIWSAGRSLETTVIYNSIIQYYIRGICLVK